jgi:hypothetical protein
MIKQADGFFPGIQTAKSLGAFYTDSEVADFLVWWAIRSPMDRVLDPSFGGGVFLQSACERIQELSGNVASQVAGIEIDPQVHGRVAQRLAAKYSVKELLLADFFRIRVGAIA